MNLYLQRFTVSTGVWGNFNRGLGKFTLFQLGGLGKLSQGFEVI
jgi:hypothetical protein